MVKASGPSVDITTLLQICRDIELCCAKVYQVYAERFADDEELGGLWRKTFAEEENHARQFSLAIRMKRDNVVVAANLDVLKAAQALKVVKSIHDGILEHLPSKLDALRSAINLEKHLVKFHLESIAEFQDESLKKTFHAMMLADRDHLQSIEMMYEKKLNAEKTS